MALAAMIILDGTLAIATAILYVYVGAITLRRPTSDAPSRRAVRLFAVWWFGLAALTLAGTLRTIVVLAGYTDPTLHNVYSWISIVPLVAILWGLVSYLGYIYIGRTSVFTVTSIFHALLLAGLAYLVAIRPVTSVALGDFGVQLGYATELSGPVTGILIAAIILPALAAAIGYASLYFRTNDRSARYRIAMVSGAFVLWFGIAGLATPAGLSDLESWPLASRVIAFLATLMVLAAYQPPRWSQKAFGLRPALARADDEGDRRLRLAGALPTLSGAT